MLAHDINEDPINRGDLVWVSWIAGEPGFIGKALGASHYRNALPPFTLLILQREDETVRSVLWMPELRGRFRRVE